MKIDEKFFVAKPITETLFHKPELASLARLQGGVETKYLNCSRDLPYLVCSRTIDLSIYE